MLTSNVGKKKKKNTNKKPDSATTTGSAPSSPVHTSSSPSSPPSTTEDDDWTQVTRKVRKERHVDDSMDATPSFSASPISIPHMSADPMTAASDWAPLPAKINAPFYKNSITKASTANKNPKNIEDRFANLLTPGRKQKNKRRISYLTFTSEPHLVRGKDKPVVVNPRKRVVRKKVNPNPTPRFKPTTENGAVSLGTTVRNSTHGS